MSKKNDDPHHVHTNTKPFAQFPRGLSRETIISISKQKQEPEWMRDIRLNAFGVFQKSRLPTFGPDLSQLDFDALTYYVNPTEKKFTAWQDVPQDIKEIYEKIGVPQAEIDYLAGNTTQYDSESIYKHLQQEWESQGVLFCDMESAVHNYPEMVQAYFGTLIPATDNMFAALNTACWSGGSFVYIPQNVDVSIPLQAYFRMNTRGLGQFERTLIIADEGSFAHYIEGCTAPMYQETSLHAAVVEIFVKRNARIRYTTIQNWSTNVYNLVTKRMKIETKGIGEWIDGNIGSGITMKYPSLVLAGEYARGDMLSLSVAGKGQVQDTGGRAMHLAPHTTSTITAKSISLQGGISTYRGKVKMVKGATDSKAAVRCDALLLDTKSHTETYPTNDIQESHATVTHEATVSKVGAEQLFFLMSRGLSEAQATSLIVNGFIQPIVKEIPFEYAIELNRLINLSMEGAVG